MSAATKKMTFEETMKKLEETAENLQKDDITLEEALKNYEKGIEYYKQCDEILKKEKQKIETYSK